MTLKNILIAGAVVIVVAFGVYLAFFRIASRESAPNAEQYGTPPAMAKIHIDAVCTGALAYMTFPDGASADAFVQECKEGKHPEVIEKYKADMQLGEGAAI